MIGGLNVTMTEFPDCRYKKSNNQRFLLGTLFFCIFFGFNVHNADATTTIKILSNSRHAYDSIVSTINMLLGTGHVGTDIVVHSTDMASGYAGSSANAALAATQRYNESGVLVPSQAPYNLYTSSFTGYPGDSISEYDLSATYDLANNYAYSASPVMPAGTPPPAFFVAPGITTYPSGYGAEWRLDQTIFCSSSLSCLTAANAGMMSALRYLHSTSTPAWNWFDVKAALRQTGANWATGYSRTAYGFGQVNYTTANALSSSQILLQPPAVTVATSTGRINFTIYPFKQTRRIKEVLFQFSSSPAFQAGELTLSAIEALGGTKITEYTSLTATSTSPIFATTTDKYFVWLTADNATDSAANFSRIDTYSILGPASQGETYFTTSFDTTSPANNAVSTTQSPTFVWGAADSYLGISKYQLFIDGVLDKDNIIGTSATPTNSLSEGSHTWDVKAFNNGGVSTTTVSTPTININTAYTSSYTFYVDNVLGSDSNPGTQALPWATLTKAGDTASAGNTVVIIKNAGVPYRETLSPVRSGTSGSVITFRGVDASNKPEIWGSSDMTTGWSVYSGGDADNHQQATTTEKQNLVAGGAHTSLTKKTQGGAAATLNPGEWFWASNVLYYRLAVGEVINSTHIEAASRDYGIIGNFKTQITYQNLIVRYANAYGAYITSSRQTASGIETYDSEAGIYMDGTNNILQYSVATRNNTEGVYIGSPTNAQVYNVLSYGNGGKGLNLFAYTGISMTLKNNIASGNTGVSFGFNFIFGTPTVTTSHNLWDTAGDANWTTYKGSSNQELVNPLLIDTSNSNFALQPLSPSIDTGTTIDGNTTDILGNPIYGTPDIGPYEYQPPYTIGTHDIDITGAVRLYKNGKYRYTNATTTGTTASFNITPVGGFPAGDYSEFMNMNITTWNTSGDYAKTWTETSTTAPSTVHTIGNLKASTYYNVLVDSAQYASVLTDGSGQATFTYTGGYSTHTFDVAEDTGAPVAPTATPVAAVSSSSQTFTWSTSSDPAGIAKYQLYTDDALKLDDITGTQTTATGFSCGTHTWYIRAFDNAGNTTDSSTQSFDVTCGGGPIMPTGTVLFNTPKPRMQTITNGVVTYLDEQVSTPVISSAVPTSSVTPSTTSSSAPSFSRTMIRGSKGNDVSALQELLKKDPTLYPEGLVTGYFAPATERAIKLLQKKYHIVSSGTPKTTGYGAVGPKTRGVLNNLREI